MVVDGALSKAFHLWGIGISRQVTTPVSAAIEHEDSLVTVLLQTQFINGVEVSC